MRQTLRAVTARDLFMSSVTLLCPPYNSVNAVVGLFCFCVLFMHFFCFVYYFLKTILLQCFSGGCALWRGSLWTKVYQVQDSNQQTFKGTIWCRIWTSQFISNLLKNVYKAWPLMISDILILKKQCISQFIKPVTPPGKQGIGTDYSMTCTSCLIIVFFIIFCFRDPTTSCH